MEIRSVDNAMFQFIALAINSLLQAEKGCCRIHCGVCASLYFLVMARRSHMNWYLLYGNGDRYDWQNKDGSLKIELLEAQWDKYKGCTNEGKCETDHEG